MTFIYHIGRIDPSPHRKFVAERLIALKAALAEEIQSRINPRNLRLATWNLMHFGDGGAYRRTPESMLYIAEIIDQFDLIAIQEANEDLSQLDDLVDNYLGPEWSYIVTDTTAGSRGNYERLAFLFRQPKVRFMNEAGEIVLPKGQRIRGTEEEGSKEELQFARTPFCVAFQSGWLRFKLCTVHIYYGKASGAELQVRREEIDRIAEFLAERQEKERKRYEKAREGSGRNSNYVLLGDFNIISPSHETMEALTRHGFAAPHAIANAASSLSGDHHYDQIVSKLADGRAKFGSGGVFDMFDHVYRDADAAEYYDVADPEKFAKDSNGKTRTDAQKATYYKRYFRKHQMSDHKLLWCEIDTDFAEEYLQEAVDA